MIVARIRPVRLGLSSAGQSSVPPVENGPNLTECRRPLFSGLLLDVTALNSRWGMKLAQTKAARHLRFGL